MNQVRAFGARARLPGNLLDLLLASLFINILSLALPVTLLQIYDRILPNAAVNTLVLLVIGVGVALIFEMILRLARSIFSAWVGARFEYLTGCAALGHMFQTDSVSFDREGSGIHMERLSALSSLKDFYAGQAIVTLLDIPFALIFIGIIAYLAQDLAYVPIVLMALFIVFAQILGIRLRQAIHQRNQSDEKRISFIIEVLSGIQTVKSMAMEAQILRRYERLQEYCAQNSHDVTARSAAAMNLGSFFSQLTMFAVVAFGAIKVIDGQLTLGALAACTILAGRAMQPLQRAAGLWARLQTVRLARDKVQNIFDMPVQQRAGLPRLDQVVGEIELTDIGFQYADNADPLLSNVSIHVQPGEMIGILGGNANGKSELLQIMMGVLKPTHGVVRVDGHRLDEIDVTSLHDAIAYLPHNPVLFKGTILDNLTMFRPELEQRALSVASHLDLETTIGSMSRGYDTVVADGAGDTLPRGVKQRIAIARGLATDPRVILFDEANAAMDTKGDETLREFLFQFKGSRTMVLVTNRPSLLALCDRCFAFEDRTLRPHSLGELGIGMAAAPGEQQDGEQQDSGQQDSGPGGTNG